MMAEVDLPEVSLLGLEDDLSCSICLSPFDFPVTLPCGHNFCQDCLLATWKDSYSCPQCRTVFSTKPELKKNTVLSSVVESFMVKVMKSEKPSLVSQQSHKNKEEESHNKVTRKEAIRCDACMEAEASHTCLTCMASYCEEHLRPHRDNPVFRLHQLMEPVGDLMERICPDHHKLMELFCSQHGRPICSLCLQQGHKGCSFTSPEEQRSLVESDLRSKLKTLDGKIKKNETVVSQMKDMDNKLRDSATNRKTIVSTEYQQMREMLAREEREALVALDREVESGQQKLKGLMKKFTENIDNLGNAKEDINSLLSRSRTFAFLQTSYNIPQAATFDPYTPRINLDSKKVKASQAFAAALKEHLAEILKQPVEARLPLNRPGTNTDMFTAAEGGSSASGSSQRHPWSYKDSECQSGHPRPLRSQSPASQSRSLQKKQNSKQQKKREQSGEDKMGERTRSVERLLDFGVRDEVYIPLELTSAEKRSELLKYATVLTLDPRTAHKRIVLTEGFTTASVSDDPRTYPDCPERFAVCSQVLSTKGFSQGRHYWELRMSSNNFVGVGLAYRSIERKGPASRLGRNSQSWCVEWFNVKLSAWHNSSETVLAAVNPKRVGVLLDCDEGTATFYNVADRAYPFHSFMFSFAEAVYPAFWIFSSGSSISLCKLNA